MRQAAWLIWAIAVVVRIRAMTLIAQPLKDRTTPEWGREPVGLPYPLRAGQERVGGATSLPPKSIKRRTT